MKNPHTAGLDLNLLVALEALLAESSVTRAAERVGLTQSAMSHKLRRLRERFDDPLLVATGGAMALTPYAQQMLGPLRHGLRQLEAVWSGPRPFEPATSTREFVVVSSDFAEFSILPLVLKHTSEHAPNIRCTILSPWGLAHQALEDGSADIVMGPSMPPVAGLVQRRVAEDELCCVVRRDHPVVRDALDLDTFLAVGHLVTTPGKHRGTHPLDEALTAMGRQRRIIMSVPHFIGGPFIVAKSDLLLTTGRAIAEEAARLLPLKVFDPPFPMPSVGIFMTWHERFTRDPGHIWLRELAARSTVEVATGTAAA